MRTILLNFMLKLGEGNPIPEATSKKLIEWADSNKAMDANNTLVAAHQCIRLGQIDRDLRQQRPAFLS